MKIEAIAHAAQRGNPYACLGMAFMFHNGKQYDVDPDEAMSWYIRSAELGCSRAKWELAKIFRDGTIVEADKDNYVMFLEAAALSGVPEARLELALSYYRGDVVSKNYTNAFEFMLQAADQRLALAEFYLGYLYTKGIGVQKDPALAKGRFEAALAYGDSELFLRIGEYYEYGHEMVQPDLAEAEKWYSYGASKGHVGCMLALSSLRETANGAPHEDLHARRERLSKSHVLEELDLIREEMESADMCMEQGMLEEAVYHYNNAADMGDGEAMFILAHIYREGIAVKRNDRLAIDYITRSALAGYPDADFVLGNLYEEGRGVTKNTSEAIYHFAMAAGHGYLAAYYPLSKYMEHPEDYVRNNVRDIVR